MIKYLKPKKCKDKKRRKRLEAPVLQVPGVRVVVGCREERPSWRSNVNLMSKEKWFSFEVKEQGSSEKR